MCLCYARLIPLFVVDTYPVVFGRELVLNGNQLAGSIPSTIGKLAAIMYAVAVSLRLQQAIAWHELLAVNHADCAGSAHAPGVVPDSWRCFCVGTSDVEGTVHECWGTVGPVGTVSNHDRGVPCRVRDSMVGRYLDLQYNQLTGFIPSTIGSCVNLQCVSTSNLIAVAVWVPSWTLSMQSCRMMCSMGCMCWLTHTAG